MVYLRILLVCAPLLVMGLSEGDPLVVETKSGRIRGFMPPNSTHATFRGVPYAAPPTGKNRWRSPQPVEPWAPAIRNATDFGAPCKQLGPAWSTMQGVAHDGSKEDCLYLNVYSPRNPVAASEKGYPTMVYFPAGQYTWGSSDDYENNAAPSFPAADDVIMVTMGYRLVCVLISQACCTLTVLFYLPLSGNLWLPSARRTSISQRG
jgi:para-nitrobenzyl esterase